MGMKVRSEYGADINSSLLEKCFNLFNILLITADGGGWRSLSAGWDLLFTFLKSVIRFMFSVVSSIELSTAVDAFVQNLYIILFFCFSK